MAQTGMNVLVAYKIEDVTFNVPNTVVTGAERLRLNPAPGLAMSRPTILPGEIRADMLTPIGRLGSRAVNGSYPCDLSVGSFDTIFEAVMRSTFVAAVSFGNAELTSITTTANTIVAAGGSFITEGVRVGDIIRLSNHSTAVNNDVNLMVSAVVAATVTLHGTPLTLDASPDSAFSITILKKLANATTPTRRSFSIEEYNQDIDQSELFSGCRFDGFTITGSPDGMATIDIPVVGASVDPKATGDSPFYTSPTLAATAGLVFVDAQIRLGGAAIASATAFSLNLTLGQAGLPVIGASVTPDVFDGKAVMSGSLSLLREDLTRITALEAETEYELHILLEEPTGTPLSAISLFLPLIKLTGADAPLGQDGGMIETLPFMVGARAAATGYDAGMMTLCTET